MYLRRTQCVYISFVFFSVFTQNARYIAHARCVNIVQIYIFVIFKIFSMLGGDTYNLTHNLLVMMMMMMMILFLNYTVLLINIVLTYTYGISEKKFKILKSFHFTETIILFLR